MHSDFRDKPYPTQIAKDDMQVVEVAVIPQNNTAAGDHYLKKVALKGKYCRILYLS